VGHWDHAVVFRLTKHGAAVHASRVKAALLILLALVPSAAEAAQCGGEGPQLKEPAICSRTFEFEGQCGRPNYQHKDWESVAFAVGSWERAPIRILTAAANVLVIARRYQASAKIFVGNSFDHDLMTPERSGVGQPVTRLSRIASWFGLVAAQSSVEVSTEGHFADIGGMQFPAGQEMAGTHIDVHLFCNPAGARYSGSLTLWYSFDHSQATDRRGSTADAN
jgi:hypothetical protein